MSEKERGGQAGAQLGSLDDFERFDKAHLVMQAAVFIGQALAAAMNSREWGVIEELRTVIAGAFAQAGVARAEMEAEEAKKNIDPIKKESYN